MLTSEILAVLIGAQVTRPSVVLTVPSFTLALEIKAVQGNIGQAGGGTILTPMVLLLPKLEYGITLHGPTPLAQMSRVSMLMVSLPFLAVLALLADMVATEAKLF